MKIRPYAVNHNDETRSNCRKARTIPLPASKTTTATIQRENPRRFSHAPGWGSPSIRHKGTTETSPNAIATAFSQTEDRAPQQHDPFHARPVAHTPTPLSITPTT